MVNGSDGTAEAENESLPKPPSASGTKREAVIDEGRDYGAVR